MENFCCRVIMMKIESILAQAGVLRDETFGALSTPIYQTATFRHPSFGVSTGYDYSRTSNPTRKVLEDTIAVLENGCSAYAFSSGMAAISAVLSIFSTGDHIIISDDLYGGTYRIFESVFSNFGIKSDYVNTSDVEEISSKINPSTKAVFIETPTNPMMKITDIKTVAAFAKKNNLLTIVDNTFMTPYYQKPLDLGADIVLHSGTKYLSGHNDILCGFAVVKDSGLSEKIAFIQNAVGAVLSPNDSWLALRGLKTLAVRLERSQENALRISEWLCGNNLVSRVYYPGDSSHEGYAVHRAQSAGSGSMVSFRVRDGLFAEKIINNVRLICFAESLGGVESLITYPYIQTHGAIPEEIRKRSGITEDLLRLSVGIENVDDLISDLSNAFYA